MVVAAQAIYWTQTPDADIFSAVFENGKGPGTVRFFGEHHVEGTPRYGIQLDQPNGKHNGTVKGHRYFKCKPNHGALVKEGKIKIQVVAWC